MFSTLNMKNFIIAGHEHSTRDSHRQRLGSVARKVDNFIQRIVISSIAGERH